MNPFELKHLLLEKHGQHVVMIHFPIALFITGVALDIAGQWTRRRELAAAAYINLLLAAAATVPAVATGLLAWQWALEGQQLKGILLLHMIFALSSTCIIWMVWYLHFFVRRGVGRLLPGWRFGLELAGIVCIGIAGHLGGALTGVNG